MKPPIQHTLLALALLSTLNLQPSTVFAAPLGTAFTYQGRLTDGAYPGQIAYYTTNAMAFRVGGTDSMMLLNASGLYVHGTFVSSSDRNEKEHFQPVSAQKVLDRVAALPISRWTYKLSPDIEHIGPMAQDFYAAFNVGPDDKHITTIDEGGVALAAIQGLNQKLNEKDAEIQDLKARLEKLEQLLDAKNGGGQ